MGGFSLTDALLVAWYIGVLALLEGLLSADNAIVLALMVRHLPKPEQRRVLYYGIWGAVGFRFIALLLSAILLKLWYFKVIGGLYLLYLAVSHFLSRKDDRTDSSATAPGNQKPGSRRLLQGFWGTVTSVTLADIAFSIDSILAAVAMADDFPFGDNGKLFIVFTGGVLGIITMRFVVRYFLILLDKFPGLAEGAYYLVAWIGLKLMVSGLHQADPYHKIIPKYIGFQIPEALFWSVMILIAVISLFVGRRPKSSDGTDVSRSLDLFDSQAEPPADEEGRESHEGEGPAGDSDSHESDHAE
jgi:YkoY family integral membrane protein